MTRVVLLGAVCLALTGCQPRGGGESDIVAAVRNDDFEAVRAYLTSGGDPDAVSRDGLPLIYIATGPRGGADVLAELIAGGADIAQPAENGRTALMNAVGWCDARMVTMLIGAGADAGYETPGGETVRDAVCSGPLDMRARVLNIIDAEL